MKTWKFVIKHEDAPIIIGSVLAESEREARARIRSGDKIDLSTLISIEVKELRPHVWEWTAEVTNDLEDDDGELITTQGYVYAETLEQACRRGEAEALEATSIEDPIVQELTVMWTHPKDHPDADEIK